MHLRTAEMERKTARIAMRTRLETPARTQDWVSVIDRRRSDSAGARAAAPTADVAECGCPEFCERDHDND